MNLKYKTNRLDAFCLRFNVRISRGAIQGLSLLTSTCIGTCMYYLQPLQVPRYMHVPRSVQRYVHVPEQTYLIYKFIKFRGCLEGASERTNVPLSSACTWTPLHHHLFLEVNNKLNKTQIVFLNGRL